MRGKLKDLMMKGSVEYSQDEQTDTSKQIHYVSEHLIILTQKMSEALVQLANQNLMISNQIALIMQGMALQNKKEQKTIQAISMKRNIPRVDLFQESQEQKQIKYVTRPNRQQKTKFQDYQERQRTPMKHGTRKERGKKLSISEKKEIFQAVKNGKKTIQESAQEYNVTTRTIYRVLQFFENNKNNQ